MDIEPGSIIASHYRVQRQLGRGGMGEVFAAQNIRTGRSVAVKLLRADSKQKNNAVARFRREAMAAGAISSDYVTQVLDVEEDDEHGIVIVFELLDGESLIERLKRTGPMAFEELFAVVEQVWMGLADAHRVGVIHRDLKPSNVYLEKRPGGGTRVKILDFGISKLPKDVGGDTLTEVGQNLGTFSFMPPEQIGKAKLVDHRADIYACATLIFQALTGHLPYAARHILELIEKKTKSDPRTLGEVLSKPVDPRLEEFLKKSLHRDPDQRFQTAVEALVAWRELRNPPASTVTPSSSEAATLAMPRPHIPQNEHERQQQQAVRASTGPRPSATSGQFAVPRVNTDTTTESTGGQRTMAMQAPQVSGEVPSATMMSQGGQGALPHHGGRSPSGTMLPAVHPGNVADPSRQPMMHGHPSTMQGMPAQPGMPAQHAQLTQSGSHATFGPAMGQSGQSGAHAFNLGDPNLPSGVGAGGGHVERNAVGTQVMDLRQTGRNRTAAMAQPPHMGPAFSSRPPQAGPPDLSAYDAGHDVATTIYRPPTSLQSHGVGPAPTAMSPATSSVEQTQRPEHRAGRNVRRRSSIPFVLSMLIIALLGFAIVALTMSWSQTGKLPWQ